MAVPPGLIERFLGNDPLAGALALSELVALGDEGEKDIFANPIPPFETTQVRRRWLRYVATRQRTVIPRLLGRLESQEVYGDAYAAAYLLAAVRESQDVKSALYRQISSSFEGSDNRSRLINQEGVGNRFIAWGCAGGDAAVLFNYVRGGSYSWEKLRIVAFRAACLSFARLNNQASWALEQLLTHTWDDHQWTELGNAPDKAVPDSAVDEYEPASQAIHVFGLWRRGDVVDKILRHWSHHPHWRVRDFGARILASMAFKRSVTPCIDWLHREQAAKVRQSLLHALARSETHAGVDALLEHYLSSGKEGETHLAKSAWCATNKYQAATALEQMSTGEDVTSAEAAVSLARLGHRHRKLDRLLQSPDNYLRMNAALAVAYLKDTAALPMILSLRDEAATERAFLSAAAAMLGKEGAAAELHRDLIAAADDAASLQRTDLFFAHRHLQTAVLDGFAAGGDGAAALRTAWSAELQPFSPIAEPIDASASVSGTAFDRQPEEKVAPAEAQSHPVIAAQHTAGQDDRVEHALQRSGHNTKVLIVTALQKEFAAVMSTLNSHDSTSAPNDPNIYVLGTYKATRTPSDSRHLLIASQSGMGKVNASALGANALRSFPNIEHILMVGIAGGCPNPENADEHVRLGDTVISNEWGIIEYDFVKHTIDKTEIRASPQKPSQKMLQAHNLLSAEAALGQRPWEGFIKQALARFDAAESFERPADSTDVLYVGDTPVDHPRDPRRRPGQPRIFAGAIATADTLQKNPNVRDYLRDKLRVRAIEMEASGLQSAVWAQGKDIMVVRGICDYCDRHKSDVWQNYAALAAAAYARALIEVLPSAWFG